MCAKIGKRAHHYLVIPTLLLPTQEEMESLKEISIDLIFISKVDNKIHLSFEKHQDEIECLQPEFHDEKEDIEPTLEIVECYLHNEYSDV